MIDDAFTNWMNSEKGLLSADPWSVFELSRLKVAGEPIYFGERLECCVNFLVKAGYRPISMENGKFYWTDSFFEKAEGKSLYDDIRVVQAAFGREALKQFWLGTKLPGYLACP